MIGRQLELDDTTSATWRSAATCTTSARSASGTPSCSSRAPDARGARVIKEHPRIGLAILEPVDLPGQVIDFVAGHHERLDGSGYPDGLSERRAYRSSPASPRSPTCTTLSRATGLTAVHGARRRRWRCCAPRTGRLLDPEVVEALAAVLDEWTRRRAIEPELQGFKLPDLTTGKVTV